MDDSVLGSKIDRTSRATAALFGFVRDRGWDRLYAVAARAPIP